MAFMQNKQTSSGEENCLFPSKSASPFPGKRRLWPAVVVVTCVTIGMSTSLFILALQQGGVEVSSLAALSLVFQGKTIETPLLVSIACLPLVVAGLGLLVWPRLATVFVVVGVLIIVFFFSPFHLSPAKIVLGIGEGEATALPVLTLFLPALFFYHAQRLTGAMDVLQQEMTKLLPNQERQMLFLVFGVGPIIEAICGFGLGTVVLLSLLGALEADKLKVAKLSLFSQIMSPWGALGVGMSLTASLSNIDVNLLSIQSALLIAPISLCFAMLTLFIAGGRKALEKYWALACGVSGLQVGGIILATRFFNVALAGPVAGLLVIAFLLVVCRQPQKRIQNGRRHTLQLLQALTPYLLIVGSLLLTQALPSLNERLQTRGVLIFNPFHLHFALLSSPGVCLFFATIIPFGLFTFPSGVLRATLGATCRHLFPGLVTILLFFGGSGLMQESGMITILAKTAGMMGNNYIWVATLVGGISGWLTGSPLSASVLAAPLQFQVSVQTGVQASWMSAVQSIAAALTALLSPINMLLITPSARMRGLKERLLRRRAPAIFWAMALLTALLQWFLQPALLSALLLLFLINGPLLGYHFWRIYRKRKENNHLQRAIHPVSTNHWKSNTARFWVQVGIYSGLVLSYVLYGSYWPITEPMLRYLDPLVFYCFSLLPTIPFALWFILRQRARLNQTVFIHGGLLGVCLGTSFLCLTLALKDSNINETVVFSCVNVITAALLAWLVFKQRLSNMTWIACLCAITGAAMVAVTSSLHWQGDVIAFLGGSLLVGNSFLIERFLIKDMREHPQLLWPTLGVQLLVMVILATLFALGSGDWRGVAHLQFTDFAILTYIALPGTLVPIIILTLLQRYVSAMTVSFFAIIDPLVSTGLAFLAGERLSLLGYIGFGFVLVSVLLQAFTGTRETSDEEREEKVVVAEIQKNTLEGGQKVMVISSSKRQQKTLGVHSRTILAHIAAVPGGMRLRDLQRRTHLSASQLQDLLNALQQKGYVIVAKRRYMLASP